MVFVYVIKSDKNGNLYKGLTKDIEQRLKEHNSGKSKSTKPHMPWSLVYYEKLDNIEAARKREKYLKTAAGRRYIKQKLAS